MPKGIALTLALLATTALPAIAQTAAPTTQGDQGPFYDPAQLPTFKGKIGSYTLTPGGEIDGFILDDGTEVNTPRRLSTQIAFTARPGDAVTIHGVKARTLPVVAAMSVTNDKTGQTAVAGAEGWGPGRGREAQGKIKTVLHGMRGEVNGAILDDGTTVRFPPMAVEEAKLQLQPGQPLYARGGGSTTPLGKVLFAAAIGPSRDQATEIRMHREGMGRGGMGFGSHEWREHDGQRGPEGMHRWGPHGDAPAAPQPPAPPPGDGPH